MTQEFWERQAKLPGLRAVIDPNDLGGHKNAYLDTLHKSALVRYGKFRKTDCVLDFGCGYGRIAFWLSPRVGSVHGLDLNQEMIRRARETLGREPLANVSVSHFGGLPIGFDAGAFDRVTCVWVVQHVLDDAEAGRIVDDLARVTRVGGRLLFIERVSDQPIESWMPAGTIKRRPLADYRRLFTRSGLACEVATPICDAGPILHRRGLDRLVLSGRVPRLAFPWIAHLDLRVRVRQVVGDWADYLFAVGKGPRLSR